MTHAIAPVLRALPPDAIDDVLVRAIASEMQTRLAEKRAEGYAGWQSSDCSNDKLLGLLHKNLEQGDLVDVINLAGMIHLRSLGLGEAIPKAPGAPIVMAHLTHGAIDIRTPKMVRIAADGAEAKVGEPHVAVLLPQFGLMFSAEPPQPAKSHADAVRIAGGSQLLGVSDWRLPEMRELQLLIDYAHSKPAISPEFFPETPTNDWYWSSTVHASDPGYAWGVTLYNGLVYDGHRGYSGFVRAVRSVPPSQ